MRKPIYEEDGHQFVLKKTSPNNRKAVEALIRERDAQIQAFKETCYEVTAGGLEMGDSLEEAVTRIMAVEAPDDSDFWFRVFAAVTDGPHDKLHPEDFDMKAAEVALSHFLPAGRRTMLERIGFLPSQAETMMWQA